MSGHAFVCFVCLHMNLPVCNKNNFPEFVIASYQAGGFHTCDQLFCSHITKSNQIHHLDGILDPFFHIVHEPAYRHSECLVL